MELDFTAADIVNTQFILCLEHAGSEAYYRTPTDEASKSILGGILRHTLDQLCEREPTEYQPSERYASREVLCSELDQDELAKLRSLPDVELAQIDDSVIDEYENISYYMVVFYDSQDRKIIGVRRASYFKALLRRRNWLVRFLDDTLVPVEDKLFKLDEDFDFIITTDQVYILRPSNFEFVAAIDDTIAERVMEKTLVLANQLLFVDFGPITHYVKSHKRAARLIASISTRDDLDSLDEDKVRALSSLTGVDLQVQNGKIRPQEGNELAFLEVLDRRRYVVDLSEAEVPEAYLAQSRRVIAGSYQEARFPSSFWL